MSLLSIDHLSVSLAGRPVLHDVSFTLKPGEFVGLIGPNGAGKSTLLRAVMGMIPASGEARLGGQNVERLTAVERARRAAYVAQGRDVAWPVPVESLVALGRTPHLAPFAPLGGADRRAIDRAMQLMDVEPLRTRIATELSGGELARVLISRALAQETPLLLADEPTAGLDPAHQISLMRLFDSMAGDGKAVLATTHDLALAARFCSRLILIKDGALVADGKPAKVLTPANLALVYGVRAFVGKADGRPIILPIDTSDPPNHESQS